MTTDNIESTLAEIEARDARMGDIAMDDPPATKDRRTLLALVRELMAEARRLREVLILARASIDAWVGGMHETIDCSDDVDLLEKIDSAMREGKGEK